MAEPLLEFDDLTVRLRGSAERDFQIQALSFALAPGAGLALLGSSGAGKTVIARLVTEPLPALAEHVAGSVRLQGRELLGLSAGVRSDLVGSSLGWIPQQPSLHPTFTIGQQIAEGVRDERTSKRRARSLALELLDQVGLPRTTRDLYPHQLGAGAERLAAIAVALARRPALIVADEPVETLDALSRAQVVDLLGSLKSTESVSLLLATHDLATVQQLADNVVVLYEGQMVEVGPVAAVLAEPLHPLTRELVRGGASPGTPNSSVEAHRGDLQGPGPAPGCAFARECTLRKAALEEFEKCLREPPPWSSDTPHRARCFFPGRAE